MSKRHSIVAISTIEAKYMAVTHASKEPFWLQQLCLEVGFEQQDIRLDCDSERAIFLEKNFAYHSKTKTWIYNIISSGR